MDIKAAAVRSEAFKHSSAIHQVYKRSGSSSVYTSIHVQQQFLRRPEEGVSHVNMSGAAAAAREFPEKRIELEIIILDLFFFLVHLNTQNRFEPYIAPAAPLATREREKKTPLDCPT